MQTHRKQALAGGRGYCLVGTEFQWGEMKSSEMDGGAGCTTM